MRRRLRPCGTCSAHDAAGHAAEAAEVLQKALRLLGHDVRCASTVYHGLRQLERFKPSHLLLDLRFPDGEGTEILYRIRHERLPVRVGLVTAASPADSLWNEALRFAPDAAFRKPWNLNRIIEWIRQPPPPPPPLPPAP
jgi:DNA-binding response OmpR family regulator